MIGQRLMRSISRILLITFCFVFLNESTTLNAHGSDKYFKIIVVDEETGRGVPLVELRTTNNSRYYTDSNGIIAFDDPTLIGQPVFSGLKAMDMNIPRRSIMKLAQY